MILTGKLIDADDFIKNLFEQAITEQDIKFAHKVKYAVDKQKEVINVDELNKDLKTIKFVWGEHIHGMD